MSSPTPDDSIAFDHEGVSIGEVEVFDKGTQRAVHSLQKQIAVLDKQLAAFGDQKAAVPDKVQSNGQVAQQNSLIEKRAKLDQQLTGLIVSTIKFTRQISM